MSPAFIKGVTTFFPAAHLTFDKFHIMKIIYFFVHAFFSGQGCFFCSCLIRLRNGQPPFGNGDIVCSGNSLFLAILFLMQQVGVLIIVVSQ